MFIDYFPDVEDISITRSNDPDTMCISLSDDKIQPSQKIEPLPDSVCIHAETNDTETNTVQDILCTADEEIAASLATTTISCTDDLATKLDETSGYIKQMPSLDEQDRNTKTGHYTITIIHTLTIMSNYGDCSIRVY